VSAALSGGISNRFLDAALEDELQAFREQLLARSAGNNMVVALVTVIAAHLTIWIFEPAQRLLFTGIALGLLYPAQVATIALAPRAKSRTAIRRLQGLLVLSDLGALAAILAMQVRLVSPLLLLGATIILLFDVAVVNRRPMAHVNAVVGAMVAAYAGTIAWQLGRQQIDLGVFWPSATIVLLAGFQCVFLARDADTVVRRIFLAERAVAEQRARIEGLLKQEISHQVAERSRALTASLAQVDLAPPAQRLEPGSQIDARYRVVRPLGQGAMGAVYEVERLTDQRRLALKIITGLLTGGQAARFAREAEIGARLQHENLVQIVDIGISPTGTPYLVMELIEGRSLDRCRGEFTDPRRALPLLAQIAAGLDALHEAGVVHRDLKPANVLVSGAEAPHARISDFGISRFRALAEPSPLADTVTPSGGGKGHALTRTGALIGTPLYMAPEAARGGQAVDRPADVFAFGLIAYELLAGRLPFAAPPALELLADRPMPPAAPLDAPQAELIMACLSESPEARPLIRDVLQRLRAWRPS